MNIKIDKDVPFRPRRVRRSVLPFKDMKIGDSVLIPQPLLNGAYYDARTAKIRIATRREDENHVRIWRTA